MTTHKSIFYQAQEQVCETLNNDDILSGKVMFVSENSKDIDYEIKNALGRQGIVGVVMTPEATYQGVTDKGEQVWDLRDFTVQVVENPIINRGQPNYANITAHDAVTRAIEVLADPRFGLFGQYCPTTIEQGEDEGLIVAQAKFNCQIRADREPGPVIPTKSGVKFTDGQFLEILNSNANIWHQSQSTSMYFFPLAGRPIANSYVANVEEVTILDEGTGNALQAIMTPTTCKRVYIGPHWYF